MSVSPGSLFVILISIIIFNFLKDSFLDFLNSTHFENKVPEILSDVYDEEKYLKSHGNEIIKVSYNPQTSSTKIKQTVIAQLEESGHDYELSLQTL